MSHVSHYSPADLSTKGNPMPIPTWMPPILTMLISTGIVAGRMGHLW